MVETRADLAAVGLPGAARDRIRVTIINSGE
jgi:hypothetical protein